MLMRAFSIVYRMPSVRRLLWRSWYQLLARRYRDRRWTFMNYGYHPPHGMAPLALHPEDEADRSCIQLYRLVVGAVDLTGRDVLELSSGRGGGASFVFRYLRPRRMVGIDVSPLAVAFSRARHAVPGLSFEVGDAERLNLAAASFDTVLNVESSHCYGDLSAFLREVRRVLRPNGIFLYADFRPRTELDAWYEELLATGLRLVLDRDITRGVLAALDADDESKRGLIASNIDRPLVRAFGHFAGLRGTMLYDGLRSGAVVYRVFAFKNDAVATCVSDSFDLRRSSARRPTTLNNSGRSSARPTGCRHRVPSMIFAISAAARLENVNRRMRCGSAPAITRRTTRAASVLVFPLLAPAITPRRSAFASQSTLVLADSVIS